MTRQQFWDLIGTPGDEPNRFKRLVKALAGMPEEEILSFKWRYYACTYEAYRIDLWGAAYLINGGCSDDGFFYFREWLLEQGQKVFEAALANPDTLADVVDVDADETEPQGLYYASRRAWECKCSGPGTEEEYERRFDEFLRLHPWDPIDEGEDWNFDHDEEMSRRFPRLWRIYVEEDADEEE